MAIHLFFFSSTDEFVNHVNQEIADTRAALLLHTRRLNDARKHYELSGRDRKVKETTANYGTANMRQAEIGGLRVLVNPGPSYELPILDEAIGYIQAKLEAFERIKKHLLPGFKGYAKIIAIFDEDIPKAFMCYETD